MSEKLSLGSLEFDANQQAAIDDIAKRALSKMDQDYSSGYPDYREGRRPLAYHNGHHARAVGEDAAKVATAIDLAPSEVALSRMAGYAHDIVQLKGRGHDESESAAWLEAEVRQHELLPEAVAKLGALAILGTEPLFTGNKLTGQKATRLRYPSRSAEHVAKSVASADLGRLHTPEGPYTAHELYREIQGKKPGEVPELEKLTAFQRGQVELVEGYSYPVRQAERVLATHRRQVVRYNKDVLEQLERGDIESWQQLIEQDKTFMRENS